MCALTNEQIAWRAARDLRDGWYANLGIGMPLMVARYIPRGTEVVLHSENGILGMGPPPKPGEEDRDIVNAGKEHATIGPGASFFDSSVSFGMIRGGHLDVAILGAYQVSGSGDIANWRVPGSKIAGIGGAADIASGAKRVWVMMTHTTKNGEPKVVKSCSFPLTAAGHVSRIYTDLAVIDVEKKGLVLRETAPGVSADEVAAKTGTSLDVDGAVGVTPVAEFPAAPAQTRR